MNKKAKALLLDDVLPTPERGQHSPIDEIAFKPKAGKAVQTVLRVRHEHVLDIMFHRCLITDRQLDAGNLFRRHYYRASNQSRVISRYGQSSGIGGGVDEEVISREQINIILARLNRKQASLMICVCGHNEFAGTWAKRKSWSVKKQTPISTLREALTETANVWKL